MVPSTRSIIAPLIRWPATWDPHRGTDPSQLKKSWRFKNSWTTSFPSNDQPRIFSSFKTTECRSGETGECYALAGEVGFCEVKTWSRGRGSPWGGGQWRGAPKLEHKLWAWTENWRIESPIFSFQALICLRVVRCSKFAVVSLPLALNSLWKRDLLSRLSKRSNFAILVEKEIKVRMRQSQWRAFSRVAYRKNNKNILANMAKMLSFILKPKNGVLIYGLWWLLRGSISENTRKGKNDSLKKTENVWLLFW